LSRIRRPWLICNRFYVRACLGPERTLSGQLAVALRERTNHHSRPRAIRRWGDVYCDRAAAVGHIHFVTK
jgi:hypothetical protein